MKIPVLWWKDLPSYLFKSVAFFKVDCRSVSLREGHCSIGRITRFLGFSLGMKKASAFSVAGDSSSSLKNGTYRNNRSNWATCSIIQCFLNGFEKLYEQNIKQNFAHKIILFLQVRSLITLLSDIGLYFLGSSFILLCDKCLGTAMDNDLLGRGFSATCKTVRSYNQANPFHMWCLLMAPLVHLPNQQPPSCSYLYCPPAT